MANPTWIVIADGARARVLAQEKDFAVLEPALEEEEVTGTTAQSRDIASDRPARSFDRGDQGRHAMAPPTDPQRFDRLVLVAAPKTPGDLRVLLPDPVRAKVVAELAGPLAAVLKIER